MLKPRLYSSFLLWLLSELFETLPEVGDLERPKLVFFFGLPTRGIVGTEFEHGAVAFFKLQHGVTLALRPRRDIAHETSLPEAPHAPTEGMLAHNVTSREEVDAVMAEAERAGPASSSVRRRPPGAATRAASWIRTTTCGRLSGIRR